MLELLWLPASFLQELLDKSMQLKQPRSNESAHDAVASLNLQGNVTLDVLREAGHAPSPFLLRGEAHLGRDLQVLS